MAFDAVAYFDEVFEAQNGLLCALMRGYFDESGTHEGSRVTTIAGYVASAQQWRRLLPLWQDALATVCEGLPVFHAADFDHYAKRRGWSDSKRDEIVATLAGLVNEGIWQGISGSVVVADYDALSNWVRKRIGGRYHFCFAVATHLLRQRTESLVTNEPLVLTFDRRDGVIGRALDHFNEILASDYRNLFGPLFFDSKEHCLFLQMADLLVYEMNHFIGGALYRGAAVRPALEKIAEQPKVHYRYHDRDTLQDLPSLLEMDRGKLEAGRHTLDLWWPASWHRDYRRNKKRYIDYMGNSPDLSKRKP